MNQVSNDRDSRRHAPVTMSQPSSLSLSSLGLTPRSTPLPAHRDPVAVDLISRDLSARVARRGRLRLVARLLGVAVEQMPFGALRGPHVEAIRGHLVAAFAPTTVASTLAALLGVARAAHAIGDLTDDDLQQILVAAQTSTVLPNRWRQRRVAEAAPLPSAPGAPSHAAEAVFLIAAAELGVARAMDLVHAERERGLAVLAT